MRSINKIFFAIFCIFALMTSPKADTLKELKDQLAKDKAEQASIIAKQKDVQNKINSAKNEISSLENDIVKYEDDIEEILLQIDELEGKIEVKEIEIGRLLNFKQKTDNSDVYLEYVFESKNISDFIYRSAIVEQLSKYNDRLVNEMTEMIDTNKKMEIDLNDKISKSEKAITDLDEKLKKYDVSVLDLERAHSDVEADIKSREKTIAYYESVYKANGCKETMELSDCMSSSNVKSFVRPLEKGTMTSEWGYRICPVHGREIHNGIDIGVAMNSNVYAAAPGIVSGVTIKSSCGGNIVVINNTVDGKLYQSIYMHLASVNVTLGQRVDITTVIGKSGGGGYTIYANGGWDKCSTGPHLHFGIKNGWGGGSTLNPRSFIDFPARGKTFYSRF